LQHKVITWISEAKHVLNVLIQKFEKLLKFKLYWTKKVHVAHVIFIGERN